LFHFFRTQGRRESSVRRVHGVANVGLTGFPIWSIRSCATAERWHDA
jgi:hypothetical protein